MPPLYNKEFSVNFEPSSFDKFFSSVELVNEITSTYRQIATRHNTKKERAGEPALSKPSYGIIFGNRLIVAQLVKLDV
jgi:hypothetical protein